MLTSFAQLIDRYEALLFDAYGVLVHVSGAMPGARELIAHLNHIAKPYCIVTNDASRLPDKSAARYGRYGLEVNADQIITSGMLLQDYFAKHRLRGALRCARSGRQSSLCRARRRRDRTGRCRIRRAGDR